MSSDGKNILSQLPAFADYVALKDFICAWDRWRGDEIAPSRSQIKLQDMPDLMRGMMLMEALSPEQLIFRFSGSLYQDIYGFDFTGLNYLDITEEGARSLRSRRLWPVASLPVMAVWATPSVLGTDFVGDSVPIMPDIPGNARKIMQVLVPVRDHHHLATERKRRGQRHVEFSDHFRYLDIGAGKPAYDVEA
jgi:hypothetical protein